MGLTGVNSPPKDVLQHISIFCKLVNTKTEEEEKKKRFPMYPMAITQKLIFFLCSMTSLNKK